MEQGDEVGLRHRAGFAGAPGFADLEFVFEDIVSLLDFPAHEVEQGNESGPQAVACGDENEILAGGRITVTDPPQGGIAVTGQLVAEHAFVDWILTVKCIVIVEGRLHILLLPGDDHRLLVDLLERPELVIDVGRIDHQDGHALPGSPARATTASFV